MSEKTEKRLEEIKQAVENVKKAWGFDQVAPRAAKEGIDDVIWLVAEVERLSKQVVDHELEMEDQTRISQGWMFSSIRANDKLDALVGSCSTAKGLISSGDSAKAEKELEDALVKARAPWTPPEE